MQKKISHTTLCCIDCLNPELAIKSMQRSMAHCSYDRVILLTNREILCPGIDVVFIAAINSREAYSAFVLHQLWEHIQTDFVLLMQWDGFVVNPMAWSNEFLQYDYIGAVWGHHSDGFRVGNGGFSFRSKKLLMATRNISLGSQVQNEDELIGRQYRPMLETDFAIRFAPENVAERFSFELTYPVKQPFGFHALFNMWLILTPAEVAPYITQLPANIVVSMQFLRLGVNYADLRQFDFASLIYRRILALDPNHVEAKRRLAAIENPRVPQRPISRNEACPCNSGQRYKNCCGKDPVVPVARGVTRGEDLQWMVSVAMRHHQINHLVHAAAIYRYVLYEQPDNAIAMQYLGVIAYQNGVLDEAVTLIERAIAIRPGIPDFYNNLGLALAALGKQEAAITCYKTALEINPQYVDAYNNLGLGLEAIGYAADAIAQYERAIALRPDFPAAHWNLSVSLLLTGQLQQGWVEYEWRLKAPELAGREKRFQQPMWQGEAVKDRVILLHSEQGFGDAIQFIRYVPLLLAHGARVVVECGAPLARLFQQIEGISRVVVSGAPLPEFDVHCPMLSLPARFNTSELDIPRDIPYFAPNVALQTTWKTKVNATDSRLKIGLVWAGSPGHKNDANRSILLEQFSALASVSNCNFISLQKGPSASQLLQAPPSLALSDIAAEVDDFADMAALIVNLDLVICVDTSMAHLAGAIGVPAWVLLPYAPDWRWQLKRDDTPWYPSLRLFRQHRIGDWADVFERVRQALQAMADEKGLT
ncbi:MAG: DUF5672 family protein [Pseudomonadota bacterium]